MSATDYQNSDELHHTKAELKSLWEWHKSFCWGGGDHHQKPVDCSDREWLSFKLAQPGYRALRDLWTKSLRVTIFAGHPKNDLEIQHLEDRIHRVEIAIGKQ